MIAIAPGAFVFLVEGLVLIAARATHSTTPAWIGLYAFAIAVGVSFFGLGIGFYFWFLAALANCGDSCLS